MADEAVLTRWSKLCGSCERWMLNGSTCDGFLLMCVSSRELDSPSIRGLVDCSAPLSDEWRVNEGAETSKAGVSPASAASPTRLLGVDDTEAADILRCGVRLPLATAVKGCGALLCSDATAGLNGRNDGIREGDTLADSERFASD